MDPTNQENKPNGGNEHRQYTESGKNYTYQPTKKQENVMHQNVKKAQQAWQNMPSEERSKRMPGGSIYEPKK